MECSGCTTESVRTRPRARAPWVALVSGLVAVLVPKCPLCVAAWLSIFGVTVGAAGMALAVLRPLALALCAVALGFVLLRRVSRSGTARARSA